jgi:hypothetical protein
MNGFAAMADEDANSCIYGGIHFRFDNVTGQSIGRLISRDDKGFVRKSGTKLKRKKNENKNCKYQN